MKLIKLKADKCLNVSGNIASIKKTDHILEMSELWECCGYCLKNHTCVRSWTTKCLKKY